MSDWKQIQARIRKAKNSSDPFAKLVELFAKTHDAMVAFEAASLEEKAGQNDEAVRWYTTAAQRFRRAEWKKKAEEALTRLGAPAPAGTAAELGAESRAEVEEVRTEESAEAHADDSAEEPAARQTAAEHAAGSEAAVPVPATGHKRRRRGRRGGRGRRRGAAAATPSLPKQAFAETTAPAVEPSARSAARAIEEPPKRQPVRPPQEAPRETHREAPRESPRETMDQPRAAWAEPEPVAPSTKRAAHGRAGEPALASRLNHLEAMLRRLVASAVHSLDEADEAPAGPGVFLLSDSDLVTSYYVEACQTLRVGLGHLLRGRTGRGAGSSMRARLAEHLGISDAKVSNYLKQHCVVRWIQLDEDASHLAHFAIAALRTPLNVE